MNLVELVRNYFNSINSYDSSIYTIINCIDNNMNAIDSKCVHRNKFWSCTDYEFKRNINLSFTLYSTSGENKLEYEDIHKLSVTQLMNTYIEVKLYDLNDDKYDNFIIMNDVYKLKVGVDVNG